MSQVADYSRPEGEDRRKAWWGVTYVRAICAQAGFLFAETPAEGDVHSFDGQIMIRAGLGVSVQVKCTGRPLSRQRSYEIKPAWRANWSQLDLPGYFVVVVVPALPTDVSVPPAVPGWMAHTRGKGEAGHGGQWTTSLASAAFWSRIDPLETSQTKITVTAGQRLTAETLELWATHLREKMAQNYGGTS